jgi:hypothetical protein
MEGMIIKPSRIRLSNKVKGPAVSCICLICVFLFVYTASSKLMTHAQFLSGLQNIRVFNGYAALLSWFVPVAEIIIAILLIIPKTIRLGLYAFTIVICVFTVYIISMLLWAKNLPCRCGGVIEKLSWLQHVWFNLAFIAIALFALWLSKTKLNLNS